MESAVVHALAITVVVILLLWVSTVAALVFITVRGVRRLIRAGRARMRRLGLSGGSGSRGIGLIGPSASATVGSAGWWVTQRDRHRMWRAVSAAEHAIGVAKRAGAPVGELPTLAGELVTAARSVDAVLRASARSHRTRTLARQEGAAIEATAAGLYRAALESLRMVAEGASNHVVSAARVEVEALAAGLRAAREASGYPAR
jgi:hypothetical protein